MRLRISMVILILFLVVAWFSIDAVSALDGENPGAVENRTIPVENDARTASERKVFQNCVGMQFISIPHGSFMMGCPPSEPGRTVFDVQHEVFIERPFFIQTTEVTQHQWEEVMGSNPSYFAQCGGACPVENISWLDTQKFIKKINQMDPYSIYRLPTEAEWEFACRAGSSTVFYNADVIDFECRDNPLEAVAWYYCNSQDQTHPVGQKAPNAWGIYDMHGNVYEWCQDIFTTRYGRISSAEVENLDDVADRVGRSCSYGDSAVECRSAARVNFKPTTRNSAIGFRLVREPVYFKIQLPPSAETLILPVNAPQISVPAISEEPAPADTLKNENIFSLQVAATKNVQKANQLVARLKQKGYSAYKVKTEISGKGIWYRVRIGEFKDIEKAEELKKNLMQDNLQSFIVQMLKESGP